jgi:aspartokinase/homoserine dehydrogenase 1
MNKQRWVVHKFGGTSVATSDRYKDVTKIIKEFPRSQRRAIVVSAMSKVTDTLFEVIRLTENRELQYETRLQNILEKHKSTATELLSASEAERLHKIFEFDTQCISEILRGVWHARNCAPLTAELVSGYGEIWSAQLLASALKESGESCTWLDAREVLVVEPFHHTVSVLWNESSPKIEKWLQNLSAELVVITGYIASTQKGISTSLKRNGSDFSASIFGQLLKAEEIQIWTDVDGVMSADPRLVPDAVVLSDMSYAEASELAYFGAKVVHPDTMAPAIMNQIPIWIKNTFNPKFRGTCISTKTSTDKIVKGFATIDNMSLINVEGTGMVGVPGVSERLFGALKEVGVSVVMISQASSEQSICFAVPEAQSELAKKAVSKTFEAEINRREIQNVARLDGCSVLAMVGDGMAKTPGVAGRLFSALGKARVNCLAIAQGSSERNISVVVPKPHIHRAVRAAHSAFFLSHQTLSIGVIGAGGVGTTFLNQLAAHAEKLKNARGIDVRIRGISNSKNMVTHETGLNILSWSSSLQKSETATDLDKFAAFINESHYPHSAIIDMTASEETTSRYAAWMESGLNVITANKKAGSGDFNYFQKLHEVARKTNRYFLYETTVGAGLPVIRTIRDLIETGDEIIEIEGVLSGTLSFLFNSYDGKTPFSEVVRAAKDKGFTEPDPRDDLSGSDVGRKLVILAREAGFSADREGVEIENLVPENLQKLSTTEFMKRISEMDAHIQSLFDKAQKRNQILRYVGRVGRDLKPEVKLMSLSKDHPFARLSGTDNIFLLRTTRYNKQPMVIQGPGAGPDVTAAGVFAELLRLADNLGAPQ